MSIYHVILLLGFGICFLSCWFQYLQILLAKTNKDLAQQKANKTSGIIYSLTKAISPLKKESAYLHLPTYAAGIIFHFGTFLCFILLAAHFFNISLLSWIQYICIIFLIISIFCGIGIFLKRTFISKLRNLSHPDDYFSNLIVTIFQTFSAITLICPKSLPYLFIYAIILGVMW